MVALINQFTLDSTIKLAVQYNLVGKPSKPYSDAIKGYHGNGWQNIELSIAQLWKHITESGFAFCTASLTSGNRKADNVKAISGILIDLDENSLTDAETDPVLRSIATLGFNTPSHLKVTDSNPDASPRCKILCLYDKPVTDAALHEQYIKLVMSKLTTVKPDTSGTDAARFSYGNQGGGWLFMGNGLSVEALHAELVKKASEVTQQQKQQTTIAHKQANNITSYEDIRQQKQSDVWLSENSRRIASALGVTGYQNNGSGYSEAIHCPCPLHNNNDASPSGFWHNDKTSPHKNHLKCQASGRTYNLKQTAQLLGIELDNVLEYRRGLRNDTRKYFLQHTFKNENGYKVQPLASFTRFNDALMMYGIGSNEWYTIKDLHAALNGLFSENTLRYSVANNLISSKDYANFECTTDDEGIFCGGFLLKSSSDISYIQVESNARNKMFVPPPPQNNGRGNRTYYYVPSEAQLMRLFDIERGIYHDWISIADLQSNHTYIEALNRVHIEQRPSRYSQKFLASRIGKSERAIREYVRRDSTLKTRRNVRYLGITTDEHSIPYERDSSRYFEFTHPRTKQIERQPYNRSVFKFWSSQNVELHAYRNVSSSYWSTKSHAKPLNDNQPESIAA